jgi:hypothetical protein
MKTKLMMLGLILGLFALMGASCGTSIVPVGGMLGPGAYVPLTGVISNPVVYVPSPGADLGVGPIILPMGGPMGGMMGY